MKVICKDTRLSFNGTLLGVDKDYEYEVTDTVTIKHMGKEYLMYIINGKPFDARRFIVLEE